MSASVSIVIPTRDRGAMLIEAVRSALAASPLEVIVVDAGSTDGSVERAAALGAGVRIVPGPARNAAAARNAGVAAARGELIGFLDSDDVMLPAKVDCLRPVLERDPGIALAHGRTVVIDEHGETDDALTRDHELRLAKAERVGTAYDALAELCVMYTSATLLRRSAFEAVGGFDESLDAYEDWDLYLRLAARWRLVYETCPTARYRVWGGNVAWDRTAAWTIHVAEKHLADPSLAPPGLAGRARYGFLRRVAFSQHVLAQPREARRAALAALRARPLAALADAEVRRPLVRSFVPRALALRRRPAATRRDRGGGSAGGGG